MEDRRAAPTPTVFPVSWDALPPDLADEEIRKLTIEVRQLDRTARRLRREIETLEREVPAARTADQAAQAAAYRAGDSDGSRATANQVTLAERTKALRSERGVAVVAMQAAQRDVVALLEARGVGYAEDARLAAGDRRDTARTHLAAARQAELEAEHLLAFARWSESRGSQPADVATATAPGLKVRRRDPDPATFAGAIRDAESVLDGAVPGRIGTPSGKHGPLTVRSGERKVV